MQLPRLPSLDPFQPYLEALGAIGDLLGGLFAGAALLIATITLRRQVEEGRRQQASKVKVRLGEARDDLINVIVTNDSDQPISEIVWNFTVWSLSPEGRHIVADTVGFGSGVAAFESKAMLINTEQVPKDAELQLRGDLHFLDVRKKAWRWEVNGGLYAERKLRFRVNKRVARYLTKPRYPI